MDLSAKAFDVLNKRFGDRTRRWLEVDKHAQLNRHGDPTLMDIYDTSTKKGMDADSI